VNLAGKKVFVTGAGGFIGSHLTEHLVKCGCDVHALVQYNSIGQWGWLENSNPEIKSSIKVSLGDVRDSFQMLELVKGIDIVFNLAALIAIPYSYSAPQSYIDTNIGGALNLAEAVKLNNCEQLIQISTSEVYGTAQFVPISEAHPLKGQSPYSASKIGADQIAMSFFHSFSTPITIIRPFNTYGPRQSSRAVIPTIITQIANGVKQIKLGATTPTRDFTFVSDTVNGITAAAGNIAVYGKTINLGTGYEFSIGQTANLIAQLMEQEIEIVSQEERMRPIDSEVERLLADNSLALRELDWTPRLAGEDGFKLGLRETIEWLTCETNLNYYKFDKFIT